MSDKEIRNIHEAICKCPRCKGTCNKHKMCAACAALDKKIDQLRK